MIVGLLLSQLTRGWVLQMIEEKVMTGFVYVAVYIINR